MKVYHHYEYSWPEGVKPMLIHEWAETLSLEEQQQFFKSQLRQFALRDQAIADGLMDIAGTDSYVWRDDAAAERNKPTDSQWLAFFNRYIQETQTIFTVREERKE